MNNMEDLDFELVTWPDSQEYIAEEGFEENACLADSDTFAETYGFSAYFINKAWKREVDGRKFTYTIEAKSEDYTIDDVFPQWEY